MKLLSVMFAMAFSVISCADDKDAGNGGGNGGDSANRAIVEAQVRQDYEGTISGLSVTEKRGYEVATFTLTDTRDVSTDIRAAKPNMTVWYKVTNAKATMKQSTEDFGTTMHDKLQTAFENTPKYGDSTLWTVTEVELDIQEEDTSETRVYEIELENNANRNLKAELYYNYDNPIKLLYSKEELDDDNNDDDKVVIDEALINAVKVVYPAPATVQVIDAEMDGTQVEVEVLVTNAGKTTENEIVFTDTTYATVASQESESEATLTYTTIDPAELKTAVEAWFTTNATKLNSTTPANEPVYVTTIITGSGASAVITYEVEVEYTNSTNEYEVELEFNSQFTVTDQEAEINGDEVTFP